MDLLLGAWVVHGFTLSTFSVCCCQTTSLTSRSCLARYRDKGTASRPSVFYVEYPRLLIFASSRRNDFVRPALVSLTLASLFFLEPTKQSRRTLAGARDDISQFFVFCLRPISRELIETRIDVVDRISESRSLVEPCTPCLQIGPCMNDNRACRGQSARCATLCDRSLHIS